MRTHLPTDLNEAIDTEFADSDYSVYVLDGQTAGPDHACDGSDDDYHDAIVLVDVGPGPEHVHKFTRRPDGSIDRRRIR